MTTPEADFTSQLIEHRLEVSELVSRIDLASPFRWLDKQDLAALSILSSRDDLWTAHCLVVGFVVATSANPDDKNAILDRLRDHTFDKWVHDHEFREFISHHPAATPEWSVEAGFAIIGQAMNLHAVVGAQMASIRLTFCLDYCRGKTDACDCFVECIRQ
ncbi:hypothetical protein ACIA98_32195 [Streptomyces sp. NPDC051366]|uniref:hypothetical protein n=1 Tax=Streptomyces sp. NPDC051366 TaxID=3365652 RepID=UPI0037AE4A8C